MAATIRRMVTPMSEHLLDPHDELAPMGPPLHRGGFNGRAEPLDDGVLVRLEGELDLATAPTLERVVNLAVDSGAPTVVLDLSALTFVDSTGIHVLIAAQRRALKQGFALVLRSPTQQVRKILRLTGLDQVMVIEPEPWAG